MRWHILKTLIHKEALRHAANRGGLVLAGLLVAGALLLAVLNPSEGGFGMIGGVHHCFIHYEEEGPWVEHLKESVPPALAKRLVFRRLDTANTRDGVIVYPTGTGAIQVRKGPPDAEGRARYLVWAWHPAGDPAGMAPYETWFWRETQRHFYSEARASLEGAGLDPDKELPEPDFDTDDLWPVRQTQADLQNQLAAVAARHPGVLSAQPAPVPAVEIKQSALSGAALDMRGAIGTGLVVFALFFTCVYLLPSLTCEERERGLLLAQALSPATPLEIVAAKFLFYPLFGLLLAGFLAGIVSTQALLKPFFWLGLLTLAVGALGIGMTVACLARNQRSASMGALCYLLAVSLVLLICQQNNVAIIPFLAIEYHAPRILHAALTDQVRPGHWVNLACSAILAGAWAASSLVIFRRRGWQ